MVLPYEMKPDFGFKVKLNHNYPERWSQHVKVRWHQLGHLIMLGVRYFVYWIYLRLKGRLPLMDYLRVQNGQQIYGVPIGGIGAGTIGRGFRGEFCRYQLRPGIYEYSTIPGNQFIVSVHSTKGDGECLFQKVLNTAKRPKNLSCWDWSYNGENGEYLGLYPRSWTTYTIPEQNLTLVCRQISPVIPNDYEDSCLPCAAFVWTVVNDGSEEKRVSITFTFQNGIGDKSDRAAGCWTETFSPSSSVQGAAMHHKVGDMPYTFGIAATENENVKVTTLDCWNALGNGDEVWDPLLRKGHFDLSKGTKTHPTKKGQLRGVAVCGETVLSGNAESQIDFALVWDMPKVHFGEGVVNYYKFYTRKFGKDGKAAFQLASYTLSQYRKWDKLIADWQSPILDDPRLPDWYKSALFNETYFVSDGGSVWFDVPEEELKKLSEDDPRRKYGRFAYLEGHEYRMYNTYDVHFYASFALAMNWPKLQTILQRDFADTVDRVDDSQQWHLMEGDICNRKKKNSIPHDVGDPGEEPFIKINSYPIHDVSEWRDLNLKYVLQCYRDYSLTQDLEELRYHWIHIRGLMRHALRWDSDGDGLIENSGCPDQTFDTWTMSGASAYCGGLWLAALFVTAHMAKLLEEDCQDEFANLLVRAKEAFESKLWNGKFYKFDSSPSGSDSIMADQLCGLWYLLCSSQQNHILPEAHVVSSLETIYNYNVLKFKNGKCGAVNGMLSNGKVDEQTIQSEEVWSGVVYALSSLFLLQGMDKEAFSTAEGLYRTVYEQIGMGFETPEALYEHGCYRAIGYMRPLSIWSIQLAYQLRKGMALGDEGHVSTQ